MSPVQSPESRFCTNPIYSNTSLATINFNLAGVRLLIEGSSYLRAAFINFGAIPLTDIDTANSFFRTSFRIFKIYNREISSGTKPRTFSATFLPRTNNHSWLAMGGCPVLPTAECMLVHIYVTCMI